MKVWGVGCRVHLQERPAQVRGVRLAQEGLHLAVTIQSVIRQSVINQSVTSQTVIRQSVIIDGALVDVDEGLHLGWERFSRHPGGNPGANLKPISHRCHPILVAFVWELTEETIDLPLGCLQGGVIRKSSRCLRVAEACAGEFLN